MIDDDRRLWTSGATAIALAVALTMSWERCSRSNTEHAQGRWDTPRHSHERELNHSHPPPPRQLQLVVKIYACCYFTLLAGLLAFVAIAALTKWQGRDERTHSRAGLDEWGRPVDGDDW
jgi:hypothetical protein